MACSVLLLAAQVPCTEPAGSLLRLFLAMFAPEDALQQPLLQMSVYLHFTKYKLQKNSSRHTARDCLFYIHASTFNTRISNADT